MGFTNLSSAARILGQRTSKAKAEAARRNGRLGGRPTKLVSKAKVTKAEYFPIQKNWSRLRPIFESKEARAIWYPNMVEYAQQRAEQYKYKLNLKRWPHELPRDFESCDWRCGREGKHGPDPAFWDYACHSACHWLVDLCLYVASTAYPDVPWRIITSQKHSTVWNGDVHRPILFDVNFSAIGIPAKQALQLARTGRELKPGQVSRPWVTAKRCRRL